MAFVGYLCRGGSGTISLLSKTRVGRAARGCPLPPIWREPLPHQNPYTAFDYRRGLTGHTLRRAPGQHKDVGTAPAISIRCVSRPKALDTPFDRTAMLGGSGPTTFDLAGLRLPAGPSSNSATPQFYRRVCALPRYQKVEHQDRPRRQKASNCSLNACGFAIRGRSPRSDSQ